MRIDLSRIIVGKRVEPRPEIWVLGYMAENKLDIQHIAEFGSGEQAEEFAVAVGKACRKLAAAQERIKVLEKVLEAPSAVDAEIKRLRAEIDGLRIWAEDSIRVDAEENDIYDEVIAHCKTALREIEK